jgi:CysZ protein
MEPPKSPLSVLNGLRLPVEAGQLLLRERGLWLPAAAPVGFSVVAFSVAVSLLVAYAGPLYAWATMWMPVLEAETWYAWLWIMPAKVTLSVLGALLFAVIAAVGLVASFLVANILASPFLDRLAERVEAIELGVPLAEGDTGLLGSVSEVFRSVREEIRKTVFFLAVIGGLTAIGFAIPGAQLVTGPAILAFAIFFLPLDYASYTLDRRRLSFREKRRWLASNKPEVVGFGVAACLICAVPVVNFFAIPTLVVGGTLLAIRRSPDLPFAPAESR